ncbi:hypothetical protein BGX30_009461, partial [Mortierella sp. GBA39]
FFVELVYPETKIITALQQIPDYRPTSTRGPQGYRGYHKTRAPNNPRTSASVFGQTPDKENQA